MGMQTMSRTETDEERNYWSLWLNKKDPDAADYLMRLYVPLVQYQVKRVKVGLPKSVTYDELVSFGYAGLYDALTKFDAARDLKFDTYASIRVRGAILDGLRRGDPMPRTLRAKMKKVEATIEQLEQKWQRDVTVEEVAVGLEMKPAEIRAIIADSFMANNLSIDEAIDASSGGESIVALLEDKTTMDPISNVIKGEDAGKLAEEIKKLTEKEQQVISLFYYEELTLSEIGRILGLSTSRVSQIHSKALFKLNKVIKPEVFY